SRSSLIFAQRYLAGLTARTDGKQNYELAFAGSWRRKARIRNLSSPRPIAGRGVVFTLAVPFGCNVCISPVIRNIDAQPGLGSEAELLAFQSPEKIRKVGALAHGGVQPLQIFIRRFRQRDALGASGIGQDNLIP